MKLLYFVPALAVLCMVPIGFISAQTDTIPSWVKGIAGLWAEGSIAEAEFINAMEFLIDGGIIQIDRINELEEENERLRQELEPSMDEKDELVQEDQVKPTVTMTSRETAEARMVANEGCREGSSGSTDMTACETEARLEEQKSYLAAAQTPEEIHRAEERVRWAKINADYANGYAKASDPDATQCHELNNEETRAEAIICYQELVIKSNEEYVKLGADYLAAAQTPEEIEIAKKLVRCNELGLEYSEAYMLVRIAETELHKAFEAHKRSPTVDAGFAIRDAAVVLKTAELGMDRIGEELMDVEFDFKTTHGEYLRSSDSAEFNELSLSRDIHPSNVWGQVLCGG